MLESASLVDNEDLQHKWAALITNAMDSKQSTPIEPFDDGWSKYEEPSISYN